VYFVNTNWTNCKSHIQQYHILPSISIIAQLWKYRSNEPLDWYSSCMKRSIEYGRVCVLHKVSENKLTKFVRFCGFALYFTFADFSPGDSFARDKKFKRIFTKKNLYKIPHVCRVSVYALELHSSADRRRRWNRVIVQKLSTDTNLYKVYNFNIYSLFGTRFSYYCYDYYCYCCIPIQCHLHKSFQIIHRTVRCRYTQ